jgi:hypothetical protein
MWVLGFKDSFYHQSTVPMPSFLIATLETHFTSLHDPRAEHSIDHKLNDIVAITICAVICGADSCIEVENYGTSKQQWLSSFLELPNGIPSHSPSRHL